MKTNLQSAREAAEQSSQNVRDFMKTHNIPVANGQSRNIKVCDHIKDEFERVKANNIETLNRLQHEHPNLYDY